MTPFKQTLLFALVQLASSFSGTPPRGTPKAFSFAPPGHSSVENNKNFNLLNEMEGSLVKSILLRHEDGYNHSLVLKTNAGVYEIEAGKDCLEIENKHNEFPVKSGSYTLSRCAPFAIFEGRRIVTTRELVLFEGGRSKGFDFYFEGLPNEKLYLRSKKGVDGLQFGLVITPPGHSNDHN